ncbi:cysteine ABC transporter [Phycicoccus sp. Root101]|nr:cysteine ABC transporter [Phycicoccus sp. Root101]
MKSHGTTSAVRYSISVVAVVAAATLLSACGGGSTGSDSSSGSGGGSAAVPSSSLISSGTLTFCADISAPPLTYFDKDQKAVGTEIELGDAIAKQLGLKSTWQNVAFNGIIPALQGRQCDAIMSQLYIKPEREKVVDFVPYMYAGNTVLVKAGNPGAVTGIENLCGRKVAAQTGTTIVDLLDAQAKKCQAAGKPTIAVSKFGRDSEAQQQLKLGLVDAYGTTVEIAGYAIKQQPGTFETVGKPFGKIETGIATAKSNAALNAALVKAFAAVRADGTYDAILKNWSLTDDALPAS